jgi:hypothetical protein
VVLSMVELAQRESDKQKERVEHETSKIPVNGK